MKTAKFKSGKKILVKDENNNEKEYDIVTFIETKIGDFLSYTDGKMKKNGEIALYINSITKDGDNLVLDCVTDKEMPYILEAIKEKISDEII